MGLFEIYSPIFQNTETMTRVPALVKGKLSVRIRNLLRLTREAHAFIVNCRDKTEKVERESSAYIHVHSLPSSWFGF